MATKAKTKCTTRFNFKAFALCALDDLTYGKLSTIILKTIREYNIQYNPQSKLVSFWINTEGYEDIFSHGIMIRTSQKPMKIRQKHQTKSKIVNMYFVHNSQ
jgi:hypothetical protein